jgi:hypothetical protein
MKNMHLGQAVRVQSGARDEGALAPAGELSATPGQSWVRALPDEPPTRSALAANSRLLEKPRLSARTAAPPRAAISRRLSGSIPAKPRRDLVLL